MLPTILAEIISILLLFVVLGFAVLRPRGLPEAVAAAPAAIIVVVSGVVSGEHALGEIRRLTPVVAFLAAILILAQLCDDEGLFTAVGGFSARAARSSPTRLLSMVFVVAAVITAVLSLDATVVLLTPVVFATAASLGLPAKPHVYACAHLANSGSLLLPVSNLTNLLAFTASGLSFGVFTVLMALPWVVAVSVEYLIFRLFFDRDLGRGATAGGQPSKPVLPVVAVVVALTLVGFGLASVAGVNPAWAAAGGATVLAGRALSRRTATVRDLLTAGSVPFLVFVLALGVVVRAVQDNGLGREADRLVPAGSSLPALLAVAGLAAVLANVVNNLPAVLVLLPAAAAAGPGVVLAVLVGVNVGPNLTYVGSLATLLWRRFLSRNDAEPVLGEFLRLGALTVPPVLSLAGLDWVNFFLADVASGFGPFLAVYLLAKQHWNAASISVVMTIGGIAGLVAQAPAGALIDATRHKRAWLIGTTALISVSVFLVTLVPNFAVITIAQLMLGTVAAIFPPTLAAIALGIVGPKKYTYQTSRMQAFNHAGNVIAAAIAGLASYLIEVRAIFWLVSILGSSSSSPRWPSTLGRSTTGSPVAWRPSRRQASGPRG
ncbi:MAG: SLC13 family permease [Pseudonocardiaceae bacterium]